MTRDALLAWIRALPADTAVMAVTTTAGWQSALVDGDVDLRRLIQMLQHILDSGHPKPPESVH